jgi:hypothetical protein
MAGRPGFLGGSRSTVAAERDGGAGFYPEEGGDGREYLQLGDLSGMDPSAPGRGFDPVWGTLGRPTQTIDPWLTDSGLSAETQSAIAEVEIFGDGFQIDGKIDTGQFSRLSDWLNMQAGFIRVQEARHVHLGRDDGESGSTPGTLWIRLDQIVLMAERSSSKQDRPNAPVVQKQRRPVAIVTPGYHLRCCLHVHADGNMQQYLESSEPHFLATTELTVRWLDNPALVGRFPFALINRSQLITILDEPSRSAGESGHGIEPRASRGVFEQGRGAA